MVAPLFNASAAPLAACPAPAPMPPAIAPVRNAVPTPSATFLPSVRLIKAFVAPPESDPPTEPAPIVTATLPAVLRVLAITAPPTAKGAAIPPPTAPMPALTPRDP